MPAHPYYFTPLLALFLLPGAWRLLRGYRGPMPHLAAGLLLLAWPALGLGFHAGAPWQNFRFGLAAMPPLAVLAALGVDRDSWKVEARARKVVVGVLALGVASGLAWMAFGGIRLTRSFVERKNWELSLVEAVEQHTTPEARLLTFGLTLTFQHYSALETLEIFRLDEAGLAALVADSKPTYLLLDVGNAEAQWVGLPPERNYAWLRSNPGLTTVTELTPYTLFRVGEP
jgi:hypothetical protein